MTLLNVITKPTIARVNGYCIGGGLAIAIGCDIRICSEKSTFGVPAAKLGIGYKAKGIMELERLVGPAFTAEIFYTGRQFSSEEAKVMRLVNHVVSEDKLDEAVADLLGRIAQNAPLSIRAVKESLIETGKPRIKRDFQLITLQSNSVKPVVIIRKGGRRSWKNVAQYLQEHKTDIFINALAGIQSAAFSLVRVSAVSLSRLTTSSPSQNSHPWF
ncbi:MAG: hypothetical protein CM15mP62_16580 [Rhodospirillaceae bacterium]|nr:MAG: hypothetical protein CM15mP62_16580 [Rhodospirillaceae bacterium]